MNSTLFGAASSTPISSTSAKAMEALNKFTTFTNTADKIKAPTFKFSGVKQLIANGELKDADSEEISDGIKVTNSQTACGPAHNAVSGTERRTETLFDFKAGKVNLVSPWRDVQWTEERRTSLMEAICSYSPSSGEVTHARVLLLGPTRSGKSSFISSVQSVFNGRVTNRAMVGSSSTSFTKKLQSFTILGQKSEGPTRLVLCDAMGLGDGEMTGLTLHDILSVIKGHVPEGHKFRPEEVVRSETENYVKWPSLKDKIHCVAFVLDASNMLAYSKGLRATFQQLREHISDLGIHQVALLTHVDEICPQTAKDVSEVYKSLSIRETMRNAAQLLGMSTSYIVPVKNYSSELDLDMNTDVLLLSAVDHILQYVDLYFQDNTPQGTGSEME